jgi:hypothetical protein
VCGLGLVGCSEDNEPLAQYTVQIVSLPDAVAPNQSFEVSVQVLTSDGDPVTKATVDLSASHAVESNETASLVETEPGTYAGSLSLQGLGLWSLQFNAVNGKGTGSVEAQVEIVCAEAAELGEICCQTENCLDGLFCVLGACAEDRLAGGAECEVDGDCLSIDCQGGLCKEALAPLIGTGDSSPDSVQWTTILSSALNDPTGLGFNPSSPSELWVANLGSESYTVIVNTGDPGQTVLNFPDRSHHFSERLMAISFGNQGTFGTCGDTRNDYHGNSPHGIDDFMGPALWPASIKEFQSYECVPSFSPLCPDAANVHLDMLHNTPFCMGIAAAGGNRFYTFNGLFGSVEFYDFKEPHSDGADGHGGEDHADGTKRRYLNLGLKRVPNVPSNMVVHPENGWLYIADTGHGRIIRMDPESGTNLGSQNTYPTEKPIEAIGNATVEEVVPQDAYAVFEPTGLAFHGGFMYVSDNANGLLTGFDMEGKRVNLLDTGLGEGTLGGITVGPDKRLYLVDRIGNRVLRIDP